MQRKVHALFWGPVVPMLVGTLVMAAVVQRRYDGRMVGGVIFRNVPLKEEVCKKTQPLTHEHHSVCRLQNVRALVQPPNAHSDGRRTRQESVRHCFLLHLPWRGKDNWGEHVA